jgi:hypothetical protein
VVSLGPAVIGVMKLQGDNGAMDVEHIGIVPLRCEA